jgi:hypothetical protein
MDDTTDTNELVDRYVAVWNEPEPAARRRLVRELWAADGCHVLETPPEAIRHAARSLGLPAPALVARGYDELDRRIDRSYEDFVAPGDHAFRAGGDASRHGEVVSFTWQMVATADGSVAGGGRAVLVLDGDGRFRRDHQFV